MKKLVLLPLMALCCLFSSCSNDDDQPSNRFLGTWNSNIIMFGFFDNDANWDYEFVGTNYIEDFTLEFKNDGTYEVSGNFPEDFSLRMLFGELEGEIYDVKIDIPFYNQSGKYELIDDNSVVLESANESRILSLNSMRFDEIQNSFQFIEGYIDRFMGLVEATGDLERELFIYDFRMNLTRQ